MSIPLAKLLAFQKWAEANWPPMMEHVARRDTEREQKPESDTNWPDLVPRNPNFNPERESDEKS